MKTGVRARYFQKYKVRKTYKDNGNKHIKGDDEEWYNKNRNKNIL